MRPHEELPLFVLWSDFLHWLLDRTEKFPKHVRFTLSGRIDAYALDVFEGIVEARYTRTRMEILKRIDLALEKLRLLLRVVHQRRYLSHDQYEYASSIVHEAGRMVGGWIKESGKA